ncbi:MAG: hypothetical protein HY266_06065 [Deltaproteobacteria bacterium]|nr:hypothetical protein [Deltaproteobacteria bacterium]
MPGLMQRKDSLRQAPYDLWSLTGQGILLLNFIGDKSNPMIFSMMPV